MSTNFYEATHKKVKNKTYVCDTDIPERMVAELLDFDPVLDNWNYVLLDAKGNIKNTINWRDIRVDTKLGNIFKYN